MCREHADGLYLEVTYLCAKLAEEAIIGTFLSVIFCLLAFFPLRLMGNWACFWLVHITTMFTSISALPLSCSSARLR